MHAKEDTTVSAATSPSGTPSLPPSPSTLIDIPNITTTSSPEAASKYFNDPDGDVIIRTSDSVDFRVQRGILKFASPVFKSMFSQPLALCSDRDHEGKDETDLLPTITLSETSMTVDMLLHFCYPIEMADFSQKGLEQSKSILNVVKAAIKYEIDIAIKSMFRVLEERSKAGRDEALAVYAIACNLKLEKQARIAARECLKWDIRGAIVPELEWMSGLDYANLLEYHDKACEAVADTFVQYSFVTDTTAAIFSPMHSGCPKELYTLYFTCEGEDPKRKELQVDTWYSDWKFALNGALVRAPLNTGFVQSFSQFTPFVKRMECRFCRDKVLDGWDQTRKAVVAAIESAVDKVELKKSWK